MPQTDLSRAVKRIRYQAEWVSRAGMDEELQEAVPELSEYGYATFDTPAGAAKHGCAKNCYGPECCVHLQERVIDQDWLEDTGRTRYVWETLESSWAIDGECIDTLSHGG